MNIYLQKDSVGIGVTDGNGSFYIQSFNQIGINDTIVFSYIGYLSLRFTLEELERLDYRVQMYAYSQQLSEVTIQGKHRRTFADYQSLKSLPRGVHSFASFIKDGKYIFFLVLKPGRFRLILLLYTQTMYLIGRLYMILLLILGQKVRSGLFHVIVMRLFIINGGFL